MPNSDKTAPLAADPRRIAFIAIRTGSGPPPPDPTSQAQAIVVGEVPSQTGDGTVWRYAIFKLEELLRLFEAAQHVAKTDKSPNWNAVLHPLDDPATLKSAGYHPVYYQDCVSALSDRERHELLSPEDLPRDLRGKLVEPIKPPLDDAGTPSANGIPRLHFAIPLRDIVRIAIYDADPAHQPLYNSGNESGPLAAFDTCRHVDLDGGTTEPEKPTAPSTDIEGSEIILVPDPVATDPDETGARPRSSADGKLFGFAALLQMRMALNGSLSGSAKSTTVGLLRLYAIADQASRHRKHGSLFDRPDGRTGLGVILDSFRIGYSRGPDKNRYGDSLQISFGEADDDKARVWDSDTKDVISCIPILKQLSIGYGSTSLRREFGFRYVRTGRSMALRFEAGCLVPQGNKIPAPFAHGFGIEGDEPQIGFAQEQPVASVNWQLAPASSTRWIFTALDGSVATATVLDKLRQRVSAVHASLRQIEDAAPISLLPLLTSLSRSSDESKNLKPIKWHFTGSLIDGKPYDRIITVTRAPAGREIDAQFFTLEPRFIGDMWGGKEWIGEKKLHAPFGLLGDHAALAAAEFPRFVLDDPADLRRPLSYDVVISAPTQNPLAKDSAACVYPPAFQPASSALALDEIQPGILFDIRAIRRTSKASRAIIGSLEIGLGTIKDTDTPPSDLTGLIRLLALAPDGSRATSALDAVIKLPVETILPGGQDDLPNAGTVSGEERAHDALILKAPDADVPLLFDLPAHDRAAQPGNDGNEPPRRMLVATEIVSRGHNHTLSLSLSATNTKNATDKIASSLHRILVIDPAPFRVAVVETHDLTATAVTDESNNVAVWNAGGENGFSWRIADDTETVHLLLPPQVIGEAMEKNKGSEDRPADVEEHKPAAARFGSLTRLDIDSTYFDTRYREPGWNLRRIMGYPGQRAPGSGLRDLRLELIYGMLTRLTPPSPGIRIAEMSSLLGAPADSLAQVHPDCAPYAKSFNSLRSAHDRRLAVDRLWSGDNPLGEVTIEDGARFTLRTSGMKTPLRWPIPGGVPAGIEDTLRTTFNSEPNGNDTDLKDNDKKSFPGGVAWAFESSNILRSVYRHPDSDGGHVRGVHLSALGGWGIQRALFDQKKTAIETDTTMGRVQRYALERIGRIGALWHRAKHVIIYQRTVVPSRQFSGEQDDLFGRPVLRKVEEYVELLEPVRRYPEKGGAVAAAGCLVGAEFVSRRIHVNSRWGGDVRDEGWQVPLWNKEFEDPGNGSGAPKHDPDDLALVYPKPLIRFLVMGENGVQKALEVGEPEKLVFYTSTLDNETGDNTDAWHPVREIDFVDLPLPALPQRKPTTDDLTDAMLPAEPPHVPGYESLTIGLVVSKETVAVTHARQDHGPVATLHNLTIGRATQMPDDGLAGNLKAAAKLGGALAQAGADIRPVLDRVISQVSTAVASAKADGKDVKGSVDRAIDRAFAIGNTGIGDAIDEATKSLRGLKAAIGKQCDGLAKRLESEADQRLGRVKAAIDRGLDEIEKEVVSPLEALRGLIAQADGKPDDVDLKQQIKDGAAWLHAGIEHLKKEAGDALDGIQLDLGFLRRAAAPEIAVLSQEINTAVSAAKTAVDSIPALVNTNYPAVAAKADEARTDASKALATLRGSANAAQMDKLPPIARRIEFAAEGGLLQVIEIADNIKREGGFSATLASEIEKSRKSLDDLADQIKQRLQLASSGLTQFLALPKALYDDVKKQLKDDIKKINFDSEIDTLADELKAVAQATDQDIHIVLQSCDRQVRAFEDQVAAAVRGLKNEATTKISDFAKNTMAPAVSDIANTLKANCSKIEGFANDLLNDGKKIVDRMKSNLNLDQYKKELKHKINKAIDNGDQKLAELQRAVEEAAGKVNREVESRVRHFTGTLQDTMRDALGVDPGQAVAEGRRLYQQGSDTLRLIRAVGDPPKTDRLGFNRPAVAYVFQEANKVVNITPAVALVNRVADTAAAVGGAAQSASNLLQSFGVRLPASAIGDQLVPDTLKNLDISKLFPSFSGLKLDNLFKSLGFPDLTDSDAVKIRHGFNKAELRAWLQADIDVPFAKSAPLLDFGPVQILVDRARFTSFARFSAGREGTQESMQGRIFGDWRLVCAGQTIVTFRQTALQFDQSGHINFNIQPERVQLADALRFLTTLVQTTQKKGGLEVVPLMRGTVPAGVAARLDMVLPPIQTGVFGISDLSLHVLFGLAALPEFEILTELAVGAKTAPFTLNVWILNGGGFLSSRLSYLPMRRPRPLLSFTFEVGILAGVGLGFTFGVVSGGVWVQVGCSIAFTWTTGPGGSTTAVSVFLLVRGNVDVAGLITASISLLLAITYDGNRMIASGSLSISVKISIFYTLSVHEHVEYVFIGAKKKSNEVSYSDHYA